MKRLSNIDDVIEYLEAFGIEFDEEDGSVSAWAYQAEETGKLYRVNASELADLVELSNHDDPAIRRDAYSHWCVDGGEEMDDDEVRGLEQAAARAGDDAVVSLCRQHLMEE